MAGKREPHLIVLLPPDVRLKEAQKRSALKRAVQDTYETAVPPLLHQVAPDPVSVANGGRQDEDARAFRRELLETLKETDRDAVILLQVVSARSEADREAIHERLGNGTNNAIMLQAARNLGNLFIRARQKERISRPVRTSMGYLVLPDKGDLWIVRIGPKIPHLRL